ncbi:hypothetical protein [Nitrosomonas sp. sh817]|uniref:hypothetical protein n=1 Tax=Nitrosomonas sp. sh817 TaxID=3070658 RepID=UPI0027DCF4B0|nr:hypothetical protein [Nitrosomonas sp. sh817]WMJ08867.1 hypothetical protein RBH92_01290 [Nitrosomonas sp. sh817]
MKAFAYAAGLLGLIPIHGWAAGSHCQPHEQIIFSCSLGKKTVSVCASKDLSADNGYLQYRFGQPGRIELNLPALPQSAPVNQFVQARSLMFSGGGGGYLRFISEPYHYIVYSAIGKGWGPKDGVAVEKSGRLMAYHECRDIPVSKLSDALFSDAGLLPDQREFMIPGID